MYVANQHRLSENDALAYARKSGNGELISLFDGELQATHIPFIIVQDTAATSEAPATYHIETHLSQVNPQWRGTNEGPALLVVNIADQHVPGHLLPREQNLHGFRKPPHGTISPYISEATLQPFTIPTGSLPTLIDS
ncbi:FMN-binding negative transcriptional regulator [Arcanobacterium hippocoleae]|uniref:FMN-binding negative transcriptional regulator n=1 Tax=Arcanobacterium hippocoleae TaxID=149017 RepID=UPI00333EDBAF